MTHRLSDTGLPGLLPPTPRPEEDEDQSDQTHQRVDKAPHKPPPSINQVDENIRILREERDKATDPVIRSRLAERLVNLELKVEESRRAVRTDSTRVTDSETYVEMIRCIIEGLTDDERERLLSALEA